MVKNKWVNKIKIQKRSGIQSEHREQKEKEAVVNWSWSGLIGWMTEIGRKEID